MYGDMPVVEIRVRLKQIFCWHKPVVSDYYDYRCPKCCFYSDRPLDGFKPQHLWWLITGRMPPAKKYDCEHLWLDDGVPDTSPLKDFGKWLPCTKCGAEKFMNHHDYDIYKSQIIQRLVV